MKARFFRLPCNPSTPDPLVAFDCDAELKRFSVFETAEAARALWGDTAVTGIAWCALSARCDGRTDEYRFWFRVFVHLQEAQPCSNAEATSTAVRLRSWLGRCMWRGSVCFSPGDGPAPARQGRSRFAMVRAAPALTGRRRFSSSPHAAPDGHSAP